jgi:hypothetical protein
MVRECFKTKSGIIFKTETLPEIGIDPNRLYPNILPRPPALFDQVKSQVIETPTSTSLFKSIGSLFQSSEAKRKAKEAEKEQKAPFISEEEEELRDSLSPHFDQLKLARFWWILEVLPVSMTSQKADNKRVSYIGCVNLTSLVWIRLTPFNKNQHGKAPSHTGGENYQIP